MLQIGHETYVEGVVVRGDTEEVLGNTYQWTLEVVMEEDEPTEASIAKRIIESYEEA